MHVATVRVRHVLISLVYILHVVSHVHLPTSAPPTDHLVMRLSTPRLHVYPTALEKTTRKLTRLGQKMAMEERDQVIF